MATEGWVFQVSSYVHDNLSKTLDDLTKESEPASAAS